MVDIKYTFTKILKTQTTDLVLINVTKREKYAAPFQIYQIYMKIFKAHIHISVMLK